MKGSMKTCLRSNFNSNFILIIILYDIILHILDKNIGKCLFASGTKFNIVAL